MSVDEIVKKRFPFFESGLRDAILEKGIRSSVVVV